MELDNTTSDYTIDSRPIDGQIYENINNMQISNENSSHAYDDNLVYEEEDENGLSAMMKDYDKNDYKGKSLNEIFGVNDPYQIQLINESTRIKEQRLYDSLVQENIIHPNNYMLDTDPIDEEGIDYYVDNLSKFKVSTDEAMKLLQKHKSKCLKVNKDENCSIC